ncbi:response regulator [Oculatella sp. LEGE 06141]|uniref:response regulator n=1 Tax=Oculatella sp. LEGE 06141 TaxID=1828648 RepID=UPI001881E53C|nr:response regulator [Oculatella sp. LEGE 06141]MBE9178797.1 response regulator [Oculatella sp. LEGE 06141]
MSTAQDTVLLVEDNPKDILLIRRAFNKANIPNPLQVVTDGDAAVLYLSRQAPYTNRDRYPFPVLVLLDLKLPRRSGAEVLMWLRQQPDLKRLPVVMLTASRESSDINRVYDLGANAYMTKPVEFNSLVDIVKTLNLHWLILNENPQIEAD